MHKKKYVLTDLRGWLIISITAVLASFICWQIYTNNIVRDPIRSDGFGYFAYLSSLIVDHDLSFRSALSNVPEGVNAQWAYGLGKHPETGRIFLKYTPGVAILASPFYLLADYLTQWLNLPRTGYSVVYQYAAVISGIFYLILGIWAVYETARIRFDTFTATLASILIVFATNVLHYGTYDLTMAHIYSFAVIALLIRELILYKRGIQSTTPRLIAKLGCLTGLIILIRVPNAIVGGLAVFLIIHNTWKDGSIRRTTYCLIGYALTVAICVSPLILFWYYSTGSFFINSYSVLIYGGVREGFNWSNPQVVNFLFSAKSGVFFWAPLTVFAFLSLPLLVKRERFWGLLIVIVLFVEIYVYSSWWLWDYGASVGSRPMVDLMPLIALPLATLIHFIFFRFGRSVVLFFAVLLIAANLLLILSSWTGAIPIGGASTYIFRKLPYRIGSNYLIDQNQARFIEIAADAEVITNNRLKVSILITNNSKARFESFSSKGIVKISWRFVKVPEDVSTKSSWDSRVNTDLSLAEGETKAETFEINLPIQSGDYILEISLVQEGVAWFHDLGMKLGTVRVFANH